MPSEGKTKGPTKAPPPQPGELEKAKEKVNPIDALKASLGVGTTVKQRPTMIKPRIRLRGHYKSVCMYGVQRTGKTHQIRLLIERFGRDRVAVIDCDRGLSTLEDLEPLAFELLNEDDFLNLHPDDLGKRYLANLDGAYEYIRTHLADVWWVCMDNSTAYSDWVEDAGDVKMAAGDYQSSRGRDDSFGMWRDTARQQLRMIRKYRHLPTNFYINALEEQEREKVFDPATNKMKETGVSWAEPALAGRKAALRYPAAWDLVVRLTREVSTNPPGTQFMADTQGDKQVVGGSRIPGSVIIPRHLNMGILLPTGERIYDPKQHWDIVKIWEKVVGMSAEEWIKWKESQKQSPAAEPATQPTGDPE